MTLHWFLVGAAVLVAVVALDRARRIAKRFEHLTESYWELRYEVGQLQARVGRLEPGPPEPPESPGAPATSPVAGATAFVPLSSLKR